MFAGVKLILSCFSQRLFVLLGCFSCRSLVNFTKDLWEKQLKKTMAIGKKKLITNHKL